MKKTFSLLLALALVLSLGLVIAVQTAIPVLGAPPNLYESCITGDSTASSIWGSIWNAQTFTPSVAHTITSVKLLLYRDLLGPVTITVEIRTASGGKPTGSVLCSGTIAGSSLTTDSLGAWYEITLGSGYSLSAGTQYAIVVRTSGGNVMNCARWRCALSDVYSGGYYLDSLDAGSTWNIPSGGSWDFMFEEWGVPPTEVWVDDDWNSQTDVDAF